MEEQLLVQELANAVGEKVSTISFWAHKKLLVFERKNGRTRVFPASENILRIRYIRQRQRLPQGFGLVEIRRDLDNNKHRIRLQKKSREE
jgi:DNA-binding transcriptional MerR regulator